jgi:hypothetical protein
MFHSRNDSLATWWFGNKALLYSPIFQFYTLNTVKVLGVMGDNSQIANNASGTNH